MLFAQQFLAAILPVSFDGNYKETIQGVANSDTDTITLLQPAVEDAIAAVEPYGVAPLGGRVGSLTIGLLFVQILTLIIFLQ
jgi:hypothetical protein